MASSFKSYTQANIGTTSTTIHTVPVGATHTVIGLSLAALTATDITVSATLTRGASTVNLISPITPLPGAGTIVVAGGDQKIVLQEGDIIKVKSSVANGYDAILSVLEIV
jgi:hypothetical protein